MVLNIIACINAFILTALISTHSCLLTNWSYQPRTHWGCWPVSIQPPPCLVGVLRNAAAQSCGQVNVFREKRAVGWSDLWTVAVVCVERVRVENRREEPLFSASFPLMACSGRGDGNKEERNVKSFQPPFVTCLLTDSLTGRGEQKRILMGPIRPLLANTPYI